MQEHLLSYSSPNAAGGPLQSGESTIATPELREAVDSGGNSIVACGLAGAQLWRGVGGDPQIDLSKECFVHCKGCKASLCKLKRRRLRILLLVAKLQLDW